MSNLMDDIGKVIQFTIEELKKENGTVKLEIGDDVATVFNNGILVLSMEEDKNLEMKVILDKPFFMDFTVREV